ncbi:DUF533 domain-containing protein [Seohaeicola saemankumensis]|uniref:DUF533 domain-containing protein n=1 Tax=Seohaeicola saemankumensis TaxID=481181 RepID=A0ABW3TC47_9RHOB
MSFVKTLATLAVGFAAAKGMQKVKEMGGTAGVKDALRKAGEPGGMADEIGAMAQKMGLPVQQEQLRGLFDRFGKGAAEMTDATESGLGSLMGAMTGMASAGAAGLGGMMSAVTEGTALGKVSEENAKLMIRAMIQSAKADGTISPEERATILDHLGDASEEEIAFVEAELAAPVDVAALARDTGAQMRDQVYSAALMAVQVDTQAERTYLRSLAKALGLSDAERDGLHSAMGRPTV